MEHLRSGVSSISIQFHFTHFFSNKVIKKPDEGVKTATGGIPGANKEAAVLQEKPLRAGAGKASRFGGP